MRHLTDLNTLRAFLYRLGVTDSLLRRRRRCALSFCLEGTSHSVRQ